MSHPVILPIIVAHEARYEQARELARLLGDVDVSLDDGTLGDWGNHAQALSWGAQQPCTHVMLIEDDAQPITEGFWESAYRAVRAAPASPISFYVGTGRPRQRGTRQAIEAADAQGSTWLEADNMLWGVCYVLPVDDIEPLIRWASGASFAAASDGLVGAWYRKEGRAVLYTWPSLVDHADGEPVIKGRHRPEARKAWRTGNIPVFRGEPVTIPRGP